jgi:hypothetical protein
VLRAVASARRNEIWEPDSPVGVLREVIAVGCRCVRVGADAATGDRERTPIDSVLTGVQGSRVFAEGLYSLVINIKETVSRVLVKHHLPLHGSGSVILPPALELNDQLVEPGVNWIWNNSKLCLNRWNLCPPVQCRAVALGIARYEWVDDLGAEGAETFTSWVKGLLERPPILPHETRVETVSKRILNARHPRKDGGIVRGHGGVIEQGRIAAAEGYPRDSADRFCVGHRSGICAVNDAVARASQAISPCDVGSILLRCSGACLTSLWTIVLLDIAEMPVAQAHLDVDGTFRWPSVGRAIEARSGVGSGVLVSVGRAKDATVHMDVVETWLAQAIGVDGPWTSSRSGGSPRAIITDTVSQKGLEGSDRAWNAAASAPVISLVAEASGRRLGEARRRMGWAEHAALRDSLVGLESRGIARRARSSPELVTRSACADRGRVIDQNGVGSFSTDASIITDGFASLLVMRMRYVGAWLASGSCQVDQDAEVGVA